jgi:Protein tyrosine and serine/threonine kinase
MASEGEAGAEISASSSSSSVLTASDRGGRPEIERAEIDLGSVVGRGQFGDVHEAMCRGQRVAVKNLRLNQSSEDVLADFKKEVAALAILSHPHIVTYMGACAPDASHLMIVQDFCPGSLEECVGEKGQPPKRQAPFHVKLQWLAGVARGMAWLHNGDPEILHLDLKPAKLRCVGPVFLIVFRFFLCVCGRREADCVILPSPLLSICLFDTPLPFLAGNAASCLTART